jgi:hypothetical protein
MIINYIKQFSVLANNIPISLWQMPGSSLQTKESNFTGVLSDTMVDYTFGHSNLNNNFSNISSQLNLSPNPQGSPLVYGGYVNYSQTGPGSDTQIQYIFGDSFGIESTGISMNQTGTILTIDNDDLINIFLNIYITPKNTLNNMFLGPVMEYELKHNNNTYNGTAGFDYQVLPFGGSGPVCNLIPVANNLTVNTGDEISMSISQINGPTGYSDGFYLYYPPGSVPNNIILSSCVFTPNENLYNYYTTNEKYEYITIQNYLLLKNNPTGPNI